MIDSTGVSGGRFRVVGSGFVQIYNPPPSPTPITEQQTRLDVNGSIRAALPPQPGVAVCYNLVIGQIIGQCVSSIRYKTNVQTFTPGLDLITRLRPVTFNWKQDGKTDMGLVAEEVAEVEPLLATYDLKGEIQGVKYDRVGVVLINAVKEQQTQIATQQTQLKQQAEQIHSLHHLLDQQQRQFLRQQQQLEALQRRLISSYRKPHIRK